MTRLMQPQNQLHQLVGYAEGEDPFGADRFVIMLDDVDMHHITFPSYVEQTRLGGADVRGLSNPEGNLAECVNDNVWRVPTAKGAGAVLILSRFDDAAHPIRGKKSWNVIGAAFGDFWNQFDERISTFEGAPHKGKAIFSVPGPDMSAISGPHLPEMFRQPVWGFSNARMTIALPFTREFNSRLDTMRQLDLMEISGDQISEADLARLRAYRDDLQTGHLLPSWAARHNPALAALFKAVYKEAGADGRSSISAKTSDAWNAAWKRNQRDLLLVEPRPADIPLN